jgi:hypothetical protein
MVTPERDTALDVWFREGERAPSFGAAEAPQAPR